MSFEVVYVFDDWHEESVSNDFADINDAVLHALALTRQMPAQATGKSCPALVRVKEDDAVQMTLRIFG